MSMSGASGALGARRVSTPAEHPAAVETPRAAPPAELRARIISSLVLAPAALAITWLGGPAFAGLIAAAGVILAREWTRMADPRGGDVAFALAAGGAAGAVIAASASYMALALAWTGAAALFAALEARGRGRALDAAAGVLYIGAPCAAIVWLRLQDAGFGEALVWFLFAAVWGADIGAYVAGRLIGGPKLAVWLSPQKTWAGLAGGVVLAAFLAPLPAAFTGWPSLIAAMAGGAVLGAVGLAGDLLESGAKRRYGVKDTGALIPGHGGLLDRVDGLMFAALALAAWVFVTGQGPAL